MAMLLVLVLAMLAQTPVPFPRPGATKPPAPAAPAPQTPPRVQPSGQPAPGHTDVPNEASLGTPVYPGAEFVGSFDAGKGQRYYLFGTNAGFLEIVNYYKTILKQKGELVYEEPAIHQFDTGSTRKRRWRSRRASR